MEAAIRKRPSQERKVIYLFLVPSFVIVGLLQAIPLFYSFYLSFQDWILLYSGSPQGFIGITNYQNAFSDPAFTEALKFTVFLVLTTVPIQLVFGTLMAFIFVGQTKFLRVSRALLVLPMVASPVAIGTLWRLLYNDTAGPINNHLLRALNIPGPLWLGDPFWAKIAIVIVDIWQWTPFVFIVMSAAITMLPQEIINAAQVDGASRWQIFFRIEIYLLLPAFLVVIMFRFLDALLELDTIYSLTRGGPGSSTINLTFTIYNKGLREFDIGSASAQSWMFMFVASILIFLIFRFTSRPEKKMR